MFLVFVSVCLPCPEVVRAQRQAAQRRVSLEMTRSASACNTSAVRILCCACGSCAGSIRCRRRYRYHCRFTLLFPLKASPESHSLVPYAHRGAPSTACKDIFTLRVRIWSPLLCCFPYVEKRLHELARIEPLACICLTLCPLAFRCCSVFDVFWWSCFSNGGRGGGGEDDLLFGDGERFANSARADGGT